MADFGDRAGGGTFGSDGFAGGDAMHYGGVGVGSGHFGEGGLGSLRGSASVSGASQDWATRAQEANLLQNRNAFDRAYAYNHNSDYAGYNGYGFMPIYYGGNWGRFYSGMMTDSMTGVAAGSTVASLPSTYSTIVVKGTPYYYSNGTNPTTRAGT